MTVGIYALYWEEQDLIYIGQSQNIESRFKEHLYKMSNQKHTNYKVQNTYSLYGVPKLVIIEECPLEDNNYKEIYWTKEFDSLNTKHGLNIIEAGQVGFGTNSNASKYTKRQILRVFCLLYKTIKSYTYIANYCKVRKSLVLDISMGNTHLWLKEYYPEKYKNIKINNINRNSGYNIHGISTKTGNNVLIDPIGTLYTIECAKEFCKAHVELSKNINASARGLLRVLDGTRSQYKGWKLKIDNMDVG